MSRPVVTHGRKFAIAAGLAGFALLGSVPALRNGFFWDDPVILERQLPTIGGILGAFFPPTGLPLWSPAYYRPVVTLSLLVDRAVWGVRPFGYHLTVLGLHALTCALVYLLAKTVLDAQRVRSEARQVLEPAAWVTDPIEIGAIAAGLVFAMHPVHAEAVAWLAGRADILATLFALIAIIGAVRLVADSAAWGWGLSALVGVSSAAALLSKESGIVLPVLCWITLRWVGTSRTLALRAIVRVGAGIAVALALRFAALGGPGQVEPRAWSANVVAVDGGVLGALAYAARRLVLPWPWPGFHATVPSADAAGLVTIGLLAALAGAACWASRGGRLAALLTGVALLPALGPALFAVSLSPIADRYLYMPSVGLALMVGAISHRVLTGRRTGGASSLSTHGAALAPVGTASAGRGEGGARASAQSATTPAGSTTGLAAHGESARAQRMAWPRVVYLVAAAVLVIALVAENVRTVALYRDDLTFWSAAARVPTPGDGYARIKLAQAVGNLGRHQEAERLAREALELGLPPPDRVIALDNLGDLAMRQGRLGEAEEWLETAAEAGPGYALSHIHLARLHRLRALQAGESVECAQGGAPPADDRGGSSGTVGHEPGAGHAGEEAWAGREDREPGRDVTQQRRAGELALALRSLERGLELEPANTEALLLRADIALDLGDRATAVSSIRKALLYLPEGEQRRRAEKALVSFENR